MCTLSNDARLLFVEVLFYWPIKILIGILWNGQSATNTVLTGALPLTSVQSNNCKNYSLSTEQQTPGNQSLQLAWSGLVTQPEVDYSEFDDDDDEKSDILRYMNLWIFSDTQFYCTVEFRSFIYYKPRVINHIERLAEGTHLGPVLFTGTSSLIDFPEAAGLPSAA